MFVARVVDLVAGVVAAVVGVVALTPFVEYD